MAAHVGARSALLPHGYEGQGPEHSSARLERFLQLCAEDNMQVANLTTPANYFHALRRQLKREFRKPLILMTPKSLLRHKRAVSTLDELGPDSSFHRLLWDDAEYLKGEKIKLVADDKIRRVVLCSGKVYYDLYEEREKRGIDDVYLLRVEQLYPFPAKALITELSRFQKADVVWCQEEPKNMGAWTFVEPYLEWVLAQVGGKAERPRYVGRAASAATATGLMAKHLAQLNAFLDEAFAAVGETGTMSNGDGNPRSDPRRIGDRSDRRPVVQEGRRRGRGRRAAGRARDRQGDAGSAGAGRRRDRGIDAKDGATVGVGALLGSIDADGTAAQGSAGADRQARPEDRDDAADRRRPGRRSQAAARPLKRRPKL